MYKIYLFLVITVFSFTNSSSQDLSLYQKKWMVQNSDTLPYRLLLPNDYDSTKKYPVIFFLHGAGERGNDNENQLKHGATFFLKEEIREKYQSIIVFPQCPVNSSWGSLLKYSEVNGKRSYDFLEDGPPGRYMVLLEELVTYILNKYPSKKGQIYVGGLSMGGMGTFELVKRMPKTFAAAFPICGGANPATAPKLKKTSWWVFHGAKDDVVPPHHSEDMVAALKKAGAKVKFNLYPNANHNSWDSAFAEPELMSWLFSQKR